MPSVESPTSSLYAQDDLRRDLLHRNALSMASPDSDRWPGTYVSSLIKNNNFSLCIFNCLLIF